LLAAPNSSWRDKVKNTEVLSRIAVTESQFYKNIARLRAGFTNTGQITGLLNSS